MNSPLYHACRNGATERVRQLLDKGAPVDEKNEYGSTALMEQLRRANGEIQRLGRELSAAKRGQGQVGPPSWQFERETLLANWNEVRCACVLCCIGVFLRCPVLNSSDATSFCSLPIARRR